MGLSEREYMGSPVPPAMSNFAGGLIVVTVICVFVIMQRSNSTCSYQYSNISSDGQFEDAMIQFNPTYSRHERLARISPIDINTAGYDDVMLLPRIYDDIAHSIISGRPFFTIDQLDDAFGIGPKRVELYRPHIEINEHSLRRNYPDQLKEFRSRNDDLSTESPHGE